MQKIEKKPVQAINKAGGKINKVPPGMAAPNFKSLLTAHPAGDSPIVDMPDTGDIGENVEVEMSEVLERIIAAKKERRDMYRTLTDNNFYLVVCFQSVDQRAEFVEKSGWQASGAFVNGLEVARRLGVDVAPVALPRKENRAMPVALRGVKVIGNPE